MPRVSRLRSLFPRTVYHILARGNNRQTVFHNPTDYDTYLHLLLKVLPPSPNVLCHHYCLMPNHVHLLLYASEPQLLTTTLHRLQLAYSLHHRRTYQTVGHLWQGRYKSLPVTEDSYLLEAGRYIERNPLAASLVEKLEDYPWTSYRSTGLGESNPLVSCSPAYAALGHAPADRQQAWRTYVAQTRLYETVPPDRLVKVFE